MLKCPLASGEVHLLGCESMTVICSYLVVKWYNYIHIVIDPLALVHK